MQMIITILVPSYGFRSANQHKSCMYARHLEYTALSIGEALVTMKQLFFWLLGGFSVSNLRSENVPPKMDFEAALGQVCKFIEIWVDSLHKGYVGTKFTMCKLTRYTKVLSGGDGVQPITFSFWFGQFIVKHIHQLLQALKSGTAGLEVRSH